MFLIEGEKYKVLTKSDLLSINDVTFSIVFKYTRYFSSWDPEIAEMYTFIIFYFNFFVT